MKKLLLTLLILVMFLTSCSSNKPIKVAYVAGITGTLSELGVHGRNAFLLKVDEINASGGLNGRTVEAIVYDDKNDPNNISGIYEILREEKIDFVVGHILSALAESVLLEAKSESPLVMTATMSTNAIDNIDDNLIRTCISNSAQGKKMAKTITEDGHISTLVVADQRNAAYTNEFAATFISNYTGETEILTYNPEDQSLDTVLEAVGSGRFDALLMITPALDTALISQKTKLLVNDMPLYSVSWSMSDDLIANGGRHVEGLKIVSQESNDDSLGTSDNFNNLYYATYNEESNFVGEITYEITTILFEAMAASDQITPEAVKASLINHSYQGIINTHNFTEFGDVNGNYNTFIIRNGKFEPND